MELLIILELYRTLFSDKIEEVMAKLGEDEKVQTKNPFYVPGINEEEWFSFPALTPLNEVLDRLDKNIKDLRQHLNLEARRKNES